MIPVAFGTDPFPRQRHQSKATFRKGSPASSRMPRMASGSSYPLFVVGGKQVVLHRLTSNVAIHGVHKMIKLIGDFDLPLPLWVIVGSQEMAEKGMPWAMRMSHTPLYVGPVGILFTDEDLAIEFIGTKAGQVPHKIENPMQFMKLLRDIQIIGATHVGIDAPTEPNPLNKRGFFPSIEQILAAYDEQYPGHQ